MSNKPVSPLLHGILDYGFAASQLAMPSNLGLNTSITQIYKLLGAGFLAVNALTDTPAGIKPILSFQDHQKVDAAFLVGLSLLTMAPIILRDKRALRFHLGFLTTAVVNYLLTDYKAIS